MMPKFTYNDIVKVRDPVHARRGQRAWVVGVFEERPGKYFEQFPAGVVYTIEFEDGCSTEMHEDSLQAADVHATEKTNRTSSAG